MSEIMNIVPGFCFSSDDLLAKFASGKKVLKGKHVKRLTENRRHNGDRKKPADCSKKWNSRFFKSVYMEEMDRAQKNGYENFSRLADGKHTVSGGSFIRRRAKCVWNRIAEEQLAEMPLMDEPIEEDVSPEEADYRMRKSRAEELIKELQADISGEEKFYYAAGKEFYHVLWHMDLTDPHLIEVLTTFTDEEWKNFVNEIDQYYDPIILDMYCDF